MVLSNLFRSHKFQVNEKKLEFNGRRVNRYSGSQLNDNQQNNLIINEITPWGVQAVWQGEDISKRGNFASDTYAFVIDSGVSDTTGDINLASNSSWHRSWITGESPFSDGAGHGTHVAGTIGALVNGKGIIGVAPGAQIVSLKVHDASNGGGSDISLTEAVNYATEIINNNNLDKSKVVINMSVNGGFSPRLDSAIKNAANQGIRFSIASGNNGKDADDYTPASAGDHPNVFAVSAVDNSYQMPFWSNWDRLDNDDNVDDVDFAAPGVNILSYGRGGSLTNLSGTSMAAPHVAGLLITGGVQANSLVNPNYPNTADPFVVTSTQTVKPLTITSPTPINQPPAPTYNIKCNSTVDEGQTLRIDIATTNVRPGSTLYWQVSGTSITAYDFTGLSFLPNLWSNPVIAPDGTSVVNLPIRNDAITEGGETIKFELFDRAGQLKKKVGETFITIQDTSKALPAIQNLWGTNGNDNIIGGETRDIITGVTPTGNTPSSMGRGQIDVLTGGPSADVFIVGDSRGVFYDDGVRNNLGTSDYALIKDFKSGEDKLQVRSGRGPYIFNVSNGNLSVYLDNYSGRLETIGPNQDELIAVLEGVTAFANSDFIGVR